MTKYNISKYHNFHIIFQSVFEYLQNTNKLFKAKKDRSFRRISWFSSHTFESLFWMYTFLIMNNMLYEKYITPCWCEPWDGHVFFEGKCSKGTWLTKDHFRNMCSFWKDLRVLLEQWLNLFNRSCSQKPSKPYLLHFYQGWQRF